MTPGEEHRACLRPRSLLTPPKASGSAFKAELIFSQAELHRVSGRSFVRTYEAPVRSTPPGYRRTFCALCGGPVPTVDKDTIKHPRRDLGR